MKKIALVTGGGGFIGSHMVDLLINKNYKVRVIDNFSGGHKKNLSHLNQSNDIEIFEQDINKLDTTSNIFKDVESVYHFAGIGDIVPSIELPTDYLNTNVQGTVKILECCRNYSVNNFIYAASSSCYGLADTPTMESFPIQPQYPYALSKHLGEVVCFHWKKIYNMNIKSIRIFNAYGPRVRTTGAYGAVFGVFLKQKLENLPFTVVGDGSQKRDFIFVTDVAEAFYDVLNTKTNSSIFNVGAGNPQTIKKLIELLEGEIVYIPKRPGEPESTYADISLITNETNWRPKIPFEEGVKKMLLNIQDWKDAPIWTKENIETATKTWFKYIK